MKKVVLILSLSLIGSDSQRELALMPTTGPPADVSVETSALAEQVTGYFKNAHNLNGVAYLCRQWKEGKDSHHTTYVATMEMSAITVSSTVYEPSPVYGLLPVATIRGTAGQPVKTHKRDDTVDGCLFGSLQKNWVGPFGDPPPFADWIKDGQVGTTAPILGKLCRSFSYTQEIRGEAEEDYYRRVDQVWVQVESDNGVCPVVGWYTIEYATPTGTPKMVCYRRYDWR